MEGADALGLIGEVGIAIAGFAGVIATLRAPGGRMGGYAALRIGGLMHLSASAVLLVFRPFALSMHAGIILLQIANAAFFRLLWPFYLGLLARTGLALVSFTYILFAPSRAEVQA